MVATPLATAPFPQVASQVRQSVEEIAMAGTSWRVTLSSGSPDSLSS